MKRIACLLLLLVALGLNGVINAQAPAFPTAEGFGKWASGGRGGRVVEVTTLEDDADNPIEGSLRWALKQYSNEPITVVFRVSGVIYLKGDIRCNRTAGTTIAGQTAPGDGICIRGGKCNFGGCQNLIIRHVRFRIGLDENNDFLAGGSIGIENASNWIIDHCTFGWSGEENMTIYDNTLTTVQWCIVHEGLYDAGHGKGVRGYGTQWGGQTATYHHNLLAHNQSRSPRFNGARSNDLNVLIDFVNNVNYNWGSAGSCYGADFDANGLTQRINFVGNYWKPGPAYPGTKSSKFVNNTSGDNPHKYRTQWYMSGNYMEGTANTDKNKDNYAGLDYSNFTSLGWKKADICMSEAFEVSDPVTTETAAEAYQSVLKGAGAFPRDTVDRRIVREVREGKAAYTGSQSAKAPGIIDRPSDVGGYPTYQTYNQISDADHDGMDDAWETAHGLDPANPEDGRTILKNGYSVLEVYLNSLCGETIEMEAAKPFGLVVATDGSGDLASLQAAIDSVPEDGQRHLIFVKNGTYREKIFIGNRWQSSQKIISIIGQNRDSVLIEWDDYNGKSISYPGKDGQITADGATCPTMTVTAPDFYMENVTVSNPSRAAQAVALYQCGDRQILKNCRITGYQDTHRTKKTCRYFYYKCLIEGAVDFIYAGGCGYFYQCTINSVAGGYVTAPEDVDYTSTLSDGNTLYYTFFFQDCYLTASDGVGAGSCYLGRPWGEKSGSIFMGCRLGSHINTAGWAKMGDETWKNCSFGEFNSLDATGKTKADVSKRVSWSLQISETDRYNLMTLEKIYAKIGGKKNVFDPVPSLVPVGPASTGSKLIKKIAATDGYVKWEASEGAIGYLLYIGQQLVGMSECNCFVNPKGGSDTYTVYAISPNGALSDVSTTRSYYSAETEMANLYAALNPVQQFSFSWELPDEDEGSVAATSAGTAIAAGKFDKGTSLTLTATPAEGFVFLGWVDMADDTVSTENPYTFALGADTRLSAVFGLESSLASVQAMPSLQAVCRDGQLSWTCSQAIERLRISDLSGRICQERDFGAEGIAPCEGRLDLGQLPGGLYLLQAETCRGNRLQAVVAKATR